MADSVEGGPGVPAGGGSLGLGLTPEQEAKFAESIGIMFGFPMIMDAREEEAEWNPDDGLA
jgi:hypothetical protein